MKVEELRIGNLVLWVIAKPHMKKVSTVVDLKTCYINDELPHNYEPIPITEEWLVKLGLIKHDPNFYSNKDRDLRLAVVNDCVHCSIGTDESGVLFKIIRYIHELQNLYFCLCEEELTLK